MTAVAPLDRIARRVAAVTIARSSGTAAAVMPAAAAAAANGLLLKKSCGETSCDPYYMCSGHDLRCYPCHDYCDDKSNNFDARICEQQCQDYIHDYMKHYATDENIQDALRALENLKSWVILMTILVAIALVFISATLLFIWKRERRIRKIKNGGQDSFFKKKLASLQYLKKKDQQMVATVSETVANQLQTAAAACTSLAATQTELTAVASASASSSASGQRTNTSSAGGTSSSSSSCGAGSNTSRAGGGSSSSNSNKLPCEDVALEFSGYDNFALKVSPVLPGKTTGVQPHQLQFTP